MQKEKLCLEEALSAARSSFVVSEKPKPKCVTPCKSAPIVDFSEMNVDFIDLDVNLSQINVSIGWMLLVLESFVAVLGAEIKSC
jgi:hypothetical protein